MKSEVKGLKSSARSLGQECNDFKEELDVVQSAIERKKDERLSQLQPGDVGDVDVVDQEEFDLMRKERTAKKGYKASMGELKGVKNQIGKLQMNIDDMKYVGPSERNEHSNLCSKRSVLLSFFVANSLRPSSSQHRYEMLTDFDEWHSVSTGSAISNFPTEEVNEDGEIMDDAEMFEKMEKERVYAADPDSIAFFQAQKTRSANMTQNSLTIKQMRRNKRSVGGGN